MLSTMVKADGVIIIPMNVEGFSKGEVVEVVDDDYLLAPVQEAGCNVAADKTRAAGDQYAHSELRARRCE